MGATVKVRTQFMSSLICDTAFSIILVLMVWFSGMRLNAVYMYNIFDFLTGSNMGIVANRYIMTHDIFF